MNYFVPCPSILFWFFPSWVAGQTTVSMRCGFCAEVTTVAITVIPRNPKTHAQAPTGDTYVFFYFCFYCLFFFPLLFLSSAPLAHILHYD